MKLITVQRQRIAYDQYKLRSAQPEDGEQVVDQPCEIFEPNGTHVATVERLSEADVAEVRAQVTKLRYDTVERVGGVVSQNRTFGSTPRREVRRRRFCTPTAFNTSEPVAAEALRGLARTLERLYASRRPSEHSRHAEMAEKVLPEWRLGGSVFTSGIANYSSALPYHFDAGNFEAVLSCMVVLRADMDGGHLCLPEYDLRFTLPDRSVFLFDGQKILHGVTPMTATAEGAYRISIVFYSLKRMWECLTLNDELIRARQLAER